MINLKTLLAADIAAAWKKAFEAGELPATDLSLVRVERARDGKADYASSLGLIKAKETGKKPTQIAESLSKHLPEKAYVGKLEVAGPGFLNIWINPAWYANRLDDIIEGVLDEERPFEGKSVNLEFISANPTGPLTLGNIRTAFSADTLANILSKVGYSVTREYYVNDAGQQIIKLGQSIIRRAIEIRGDKVEYPDEMYQGEYVVDLAQQVAEALAENEGQEFTSEDLDNSDLVFKIGREGALILLENIKNTVKNDLKIQFDIWTSEQALRESGKIEQVLEKLRQAGATYQKDGKEWLKTSDYGDEQDRVLVKSDGEYAYIAPDIAYHADKYEREYDEIFTFLGPDHQGHIIKLVASMKALGEDVEKLHVLASAWLRFTENGQVVKFSKRAGNILEPKDLILDVGYDATRYFMLKHSLTTHMDFDLDLAREQSERNPVYYVQYSFVRLQSILRKAKQEGVIMGTGDKIDLSNQAELSLTGEIELMSKMYQWPEILQDAAETFEVQGVATYAYDLARVIHRFYKRVPVLSEKDEKIRSYRLQLVLAAKRVMGDVLDVLSLSKPEVM